MLVQWISPVSQSSSLLRQQRPQPSQSDSPLRRAELLQRLGLPERALRSLGQRGTVGQIGEARGDIPFRHSFAFVRQDGTAPRLAGSHRAFVADRGRRRTGKSPLVSGRPRRDLPTMWVGGMPRQATRIRFHESGRNECGSAAFLDLNVRRPLPVDCEAGEKVA